jgi:hypothetical protein
MKLKLIATHKKTASTYVRDPKTYTTEDLEQIAENTGYLECEFGEVKHYKYDAERSTHIYKSLWFDDNNDLWCVSLLFVFLGSEDLQLEFSGNSSFESADEAAARAEYDK